jgi:lysophospholipase L1-like esterase
MRRIKILLIVLLGYGVIALWGCAKREIKNIDAKGKNIICFGDSLTFGYGAQAGQDYPAALAKMLEIPVINAGIDGDTTTEGLKRLKSDVLEREPILVIIEFGGNDFLRKTPREVTIGNIGDMVDLIQERGAMVAVADISAGMFLAEYGQAFSRLAKEKQTIFIPGIMGGIITNPSMKSDFLHPNGEGYKLIAQRVYQTILPYLEQNGCLKKSQK